MSVKAEQISQGMTQGGAAIAVGSYGALQWLNDNSAAVVAMCAVAGLILSAVGIGIQTYLGWKRGRES